MASRCRCVYIVKLLQKLGAGIDGNGKVGTSAIVLSGGYEDDEDHGDEIIYTGAGGNDPSSGKQTEDQTWENKGNAGLLKSMDQGLTVRVTRGHQHKSDYSPRSGFRSRKTPIFSRGSGVNPFNSKYNKLRIGVTNN